DIGLSRSDLPSRDEHLGRTRRVVVGTSRDFGNFLCDGQFRRLNRSSSTHHSPWTGECFGFYLCIPSASEWGHSMMRVTGSSQLGHFGWSLYDRLLRDANGTSSPHDSRIESLTFRD